MVAIQFKCTYNRYRKLTVWHTLFNERLSSEVHRANQAVNLRSKNNDLRDERSSLKRKLETEGAEVQKALDERDA
jgi:hypothetical protein